MVRNLERRLAKLEPPPTPIQRERRVLRAICNTDDEAAAIEREAQELVAQGFDVCAIIHRIVDPPSHARA